MSSCPEGAMTVPARTDVLGIGISAIDPDMAMDVMDGWIRQAARQYVCVATVHSVMEGFRDPAVRAALNGSGLTTPDGMPLVWISRSGGHRHVARVYGPDLLLDFCRRSAGKGYRHFFYGGAEGVSDELGARLRSRFPGLEVAGALSPPYRPLTPAEDHDVVATINRASPDVVWVGLGAPKQERWMADHRPLLDAPVLVGVGAAFDFHVGRVTQAPRWMQRIGLEWLFRLIQEPRRLWYRYLVYNPWFVALVLRQRLVRRSRDTARVSAATTAGPAVGWIE